jgi:hypothetical protein
VQHLDFRQGQAGGGHHVQVGPQRCVVRVEHPLDSFQTHLSSGHAHHDLHHAPDLNANNNDEQKFRTTMTSKNFKQQ